MSGDPRHPPDLPGDAVAKVAMNRVTGAFADPSLESACAAQLFRMAFPCHAFLMALTLAILIWTSLSVPADLLPFVSIVTFITTLSLVSRVLIHRIHDTVRGQRLGSWTWTAQSVLRCVAIALGGYVVATATGCENLQSHQVAPFAGLTAALLNGSYGLGFWHKLGLIGLMLLDGLCASALCGEVALAGESMIVVGFVVAHMVEMHLRHSYAEVQLLKEDQQEKRGLAERNEQLDERNEQLQTSNERLLYDVQRRGRPLDDDDDRSAIRRGLQARPSPDSPPPSLPPGPPSSTSSGSTARTTAPPLTVAELVARHVEREVANVLLSCARGQTDHQCQSAETACIGVTATACSPSAAPSVPFHPVSPSAAPSIPFHSVSPSAAPSVPLTQCATLTDTASVSSVVAAPAASHELTGGLGCSQSDTDYLAASNGVPTLTPEQEALLVARRDILAAQDQIHVYRVVRTLGTALKVTRLEVGTVRALHAVLQQLARPGMYDSEAYRSTGASRSNFSKWKRRVAHIQSAGGGGSAAYEHLVWSEAAL